MWKICLSILFVNAVLALEGLNTCFEEKEVPVVVKVPAKVPQETKTFKWCLSKFPPRCESTKIIYVEGYREEIHYQKNRTRVCCKGYTEARNKCIPVCSITCLHGKCKEPETCECEPGWTGSNCAIRCVNSSDPNSTDIVICDHSSEDKVWSSASLKIVDTNEFVTIDGANASSTATATLILLIGMIIIVLLISGFLIMKYRRKLKLLNSELAFVTYISRKESNDRFDNPLYSYQATEYKPPLSPSGQSPQLIPPQQASSSSFLSSKAAFLSGFNRGPELVTSSSSSSCKASSIEKQSGLSNDFLKPLNSSPSCYEDLKTSKREYNSNIYEDGDNHCGSKFLPPTIPPPSPTSTTSTLTKEPVYAEIPGSRSFNSDNSDDEDLKENQYDVPRPINSPNNSQDNDKLDNLK